MIFWLTCIVLTIFIGAIVVAPIWKKSEGQSANSDVDVYRAQIAEIEKDQERGVLDEAEAEAARNEVVRRLIAADANATVFKETTPRRGIGIAVVAALMATGLGGYAFLGAPGYGDLPLAVRFVQSDDMRANRPGQAALEANAPARPAIEVPDDYLETVNQLRAIVPTRPDDQKGWELLTYHEAQLGNFGAAAAGQARVIAIKGPDVTADDYRMEVDLLVMAAGGFVSPEAEEASLKAIKIDPKNVGAKYYLGLLYYQTDRADLAFKLWRPIVAEAQAGDMHAAAARELIVDAAYLSGLSKYELPPLPGPTLADIEAASDLSAEDRQQMIAGMVSNLSQRLAQDGGSAQDWARLITSYAVLGDTDAAGEVWAEAQEVFADRPEAMKILRDAAGQAGLNDQ